MILTNLFIDMSAFYVVLLFHLLRVCDTRNAEIGINVEWHDSSSVFTTGFEVQLEPAVNKEGI